jgi:hypothetical protein
VIAKYRAWICDQLDLMAALPELDGRDLRKWSQGRPWTIIPVIIHKNELYHSVMTKKPTADVAGAIAAMQATPAGSAPA